MSKKEGSNAKHKRGKTALKILGIIAAVITVLSCIGIIATAVSNKANIQLAQSFKKVQSDDRVLPVFEDGYWTFTTDKDLKILQLTDIHIGGGWMSAKKDSLAINAVASMVTAEKPDLVIVTGDISFPVPFQSGTLNNKNAAKTFAALMESLEIYWVPVYGNHDTEAYSLYSREQLSEFYGSDDLKYCLFETGDEEVDGCGNSAILVKNSKGVITQSLFLFDSHSYTDGDSFGIFWKYDNIHENQIEWYKKLVGEFNAQNAEAIEKGYETEEEKTEAIKKFGTVPSLAFYHIPSEEYMTAWKEYCENGRKDTENVKLLYGTAGESGRVICIGTHPDNLFETMQELGSTKGIFCGHDHLNTFSLDYKGIRLTYGYSIDYLAYSGISKVGTQRGCTIITVSPDGSFTNEGSSYYQDKYQILSGGTKESVTMQDLDKEANPDDPIFKLDK